MTDLAGMLKRSGRRGPRRAGSGKLIRTFSVVAALFGLAFLIRAQKIGVAVQELDRTFSSAHSDRKGAGEGLALPDPHATRRRRQGKRHEREDWQLEEPTGSGPPSVVLVRSPGKSSNETHPTFSFRPARPGCSVRAKLDDNPSISVSSPYRVATRVLEGSHVIRFQCKRQPAAVFRWRVDLTPPKIRVIRTSPRI